mgnify:CR=1 FL=1
MFNGFIVFLQKINNDSMDLEDHKAAAEENLRAWHGPRRKRLRASGPIGLEYRGAHAGPLVLLG